MNKMIIASNGSATRASYVSRDTPGIVLPPHLNVETLQLNGEGIIEEAYADDMVLLVSGIFPSTIRRLNPSKTDHYFGGQH